MVQTVNPSPGSIVTCRSRQWVVLPSENQDVIRLRPLSGNEDEIAGIYQQLLQEKLESIQSATFPLPQANSVQDHAAALLLMDAARLLLRSGAGPFRCLGRLSLCPRPYQLVPLLMALKLETVKLLIADDVGIGKTIEAGLIARELLDRSEVKRIAVLCPPHLCDQWQQELREKFHIDAVVVRSGTASKLERNIPNNDSVFSYYRHLIVSLDYAKAERRRASFITHCPDLVIVDEAHTCARPNKTTTSQQQRHQLITEIAQKQEQHLLLLTATPHSGIEESFLSLLGLLKPEFEHFNLNSLTDKQRDNLANHFVQRRRADVKVWLGNETPFPERESSEEPYKLSKEYKELFDEVYDFARGLVKTTTADMTHAQRRGRYWSALALIRCVMSSPAAAIATLNRQVGKSGDAFSFRDATANGNPNRERLLNDLDEDLMSSYVHDPTEQEQAVDASPTVVIEQGQQSYKDADKRKLKAFVQAAEKLQGGKDQKLQSCIATVESLLKDEMNPIIWCRYIATANYVADALRQKLQKKGSEQRIGRVSRLEATANPQGQIRVIAITGELSEDEREIRLEELKSYPQRVLVATDCLSEGVNLQTHFSGVIHYDLPWNPNRLEQREGRIDRYGQTASKVKACLLYGRDNPVDGAVLDVLIRKAVQIHKSLGITVPVPMESTTVAEAVFKSLFEHSTEAIQLSLFEFQEESAVDKVHKNWDNALEREKINRTRFAQRAIKPEQVEQELIDSDQILGNEQDVERFVLSACDRISCSLIKKKQGWLLSQPPDFLKSTIEDKSRLLSFTTPAPEGVEYVGRNHSLVEGLAQYILEDALSYRTEPIAARCGFTTTNAVQKRTTLLLVRLRHLLDSSKRSTETRNTTLLAEECAVIGFRGSPSSPNWLSPLEATSLLQQAKPVSDVGKAIKQVEIADLLERLEELQPDLEKFAGQRAEELLQSHRRVRVMTQEGRIRVTPQLPMDILGLFILQPGRK
ncbi:DEAD/DEAH box helicase [Komarekiella sp. 'clone 1']|uniref:DEAD/DEAH box helicase n=1 Tax=Komarekiella delphini-convector SJRDD-AB1 TaxID=2593771 RepID=A0AA40T4Q2_9NOST|nr:helicase-related protein [Komarekiella delphini-convector]MBD6620898.1 DEAD/DEAH box helicase [Komarekiella delphini-convector SJRDD-AB1]